MDCISERKFREYVAAVVDGETSIAAEVYANYADDESFIQMVNLYHELSE